MATDVLRMQGATSSAAMEPVKQDKQIHVFNEC